MTNKHCAYNLTTGEIITTTNRATLNRCVKIISRNDIRYYGQKSQWVFGHNGYDNMVDKIRSKMTIPQW